MSADPLVFVATDTPADADLAVVDAGLDAHNLAAAPLTDVASFAVLASDASGQVVGGAVGRTWGLCCELQQLWVAAPQRRAGVGTRLLRDFESHARTRGCRVFYLTTLSFQAPDFYARHGYAVLAQISGYPQGIVKYHMHKVEG